MLPGTRTSTVLVVLIVVCGTNYYPSEFSDVSDCMSGSEFLTGTYDWAIQFSQSPTVPGTVGTYPLTVWEKSLGTVRLGRIVEWIVGGQTPRA